MQYDCNCSHLSLQGVSVGTNGAIAMAEALMINKSLHTLEWVEAITCVKHAYFYV